MVCPECGESYREDFEQCPECEVDLLDEEVEGAEEELEFVPLVEVMEVEFFSLVTSRLEEAGIPWFVQSAVSRDHPAATVYVGQSRAGDARALVAALSPVGVSGGN
jgi:hypothetical protein